MPLGGVEEWRAGTVIRGRRLETHRRLVGLQVLVQVLVLVDRSQRRQEFAGRL